MPASKTASRSILKRPMFDRSIPGGAMCTGGTDGTDSSTEWISNPGAKTPLSIGRLMRRACLYCVLFLVASSNLLVGQSESVLYSFNAFAVQPWGLVADGKGNLYGTTLYGGNTNCSPAGCGQVYRLTSP